MIQVTTIPVYINMFSGLSPAIALTAIVVQMDI